MAARRGAATPQTHQVPQGAGRPWYTRIRAPGIPETWVFPGSRYWVPVLTGPTTLAVHRQCLYSGSHPALSGAVLGSCLPDPGPTQIGLERAGIGSSGPPLYHCNSPSVDGIN